MLNKAREQAKANYKELPEKPAEEETPTGKKKVIKYDDKTCQQAPDDSNSPTKEKKEPVKFIEPNLKAFMERNMPKLKVHTNITDMKTWKKKKGLDESTKVFIVSGGYGFLKKSLKKRGWVGNKDHESPCFDLKWTLKSKDIDHNTLNNE